MAPPKPFECAPNFKFNLLILLILILKLFKCVPTMAVGEIKNAFHATCVFEDEIFALFVPASTSAKGSASSGLQGRWLDDTATVAEAQLSNNQKLLLLKKSPPPSLALGGRSQSAMLPEASRHHRSKTCAFFFSSFFGRALTFSSETEPRFLGCFVDRAVATRTRRRSPKDLQACS